jgi:hypothetical protein
MKYKPTWRLIAKSLGEKSGKNNKEADKIAFIRFLMFLSILITNAFIIANAIRHWNPEPIQIEIHEIPSSLPQTQTQGTLL